MSGHTVAPQLRPVAHVGAGQEGDMLPRGNQLTGMRVTIMLDKEDWTPEAIDARLAQVRKTIDEFIESRRR